ncbi:MAG: FkbM family methyltransferase [Candidatus Scalinduaceae bacterium]
MRSIYLNQSFKNFYQRYPLTLIDIGASGGMKNNWKPAEKYLKIIGFEPDKREFSNLRIREKHNAKYINKGLYNKKTSLNFYLAKNQQVSSVFIPNKSFLDKFPEIERFDTVGRVKIETDTLDNLFSMQAFDEPDFIKLDTQGTELFILQGAEGILRDFIFGIEVEVEFTELYKSQPLFSEVDGFIRKHGFQLFDLQGCYWKRKTGKNYYKKKGQLIFGNALYLRESGNFNIVIDSIQDSFKRKSKVLKAISICILYGYFDYAMELLSMSINIFDKDEYKAIEKRIKHSIRFESMIPHFKGKGLMLNIISSMLYSALEIVKPNHNGWAITDRKLGNL